MKKIFAALMLVQLLAAVPVAALAQDMTKLSCKEFMDSGDAGIGMTLVWLDGYLSALKNDPNMDEAWMEELGTEVGKFCSQNPAKPVFDAIRAFM